jgi:lipopolysaccharide biosynthesis glycosyltransferase
VDEERIPEKALEYLERFPYSPYSDQDALNVACEGLWKQMDPRWNYQGYSKRSISNLSAAQRPGIVHFVTRLKPWDARYLNLNAGLYDDFRARTSFARRPEDRLGDALTVIWSRLKRVLKRSVVVRHVWDQLRSPQSHSGRNSAPRVSAGERQ